WAGLTCITRPVAEPSPEGSNPKLSWNWITKYSSSDEPEEAQDKVNGLVKRTRAVEYDLAGRPIKMHITGDGASLPPTEFTYDEATGATISRQFACESSCEGFDQQRVTTTYDKLGRPFKYEDADGNVSEVGYDLMGRPAISTDGKGTQLAIYD